MKRLKTLVAVVLIFASAGLTALGAAGYSVLSLLQGSAAPPTTPNWEGLIAFVVFLGTIGFVLYEQRGAIERLNDRSFDNAPLVRFQSPELDLNGSGNAVLTVPCTNEGNQPARIRAADVIWSSGERTLQLSVKVGTTIYPGVANRLLFIAVAGPVGVLGSKAATWTMCYSDLSGRGFDTENKVRGVFTPNSLKAAIAEEGLDESSARARHESHKRLNHP